jgi:tRNA(Met) cytidine acetyltransferase
VTDRAPRGPNGAIEAPAADADRRRGCVVLRGTRAETEAAARALVGRLPPGEAVELGGAAEGLLRSESGRSPRRRTTMRLLGRGVTAVVLDLHDGLDADLLGLAEGLVRGGGCLVLRMPPEAETPTGLDARLAVWPHGPGDVTHRAWSRLLRALRHAPEAVCVAGAGEPLPPLAVAPAPLGGTAAQRDGAAAIARALQVTTQDNVESPVIAIIARRGRGKSAALGLALASLPADRRARVAVGAPSTEAAAEVRRFAGGPVRVLSPAELCEPSLDAEAVVIDEAAQLPLPLLRRVVAARPAAPLALATTCDGYEGTGRGFVLRFLAWLRTTGRPLRVVTLDEPIRWPQHDPLERIVSDILCLEGLPLEPQPLSSSPLGPAPRVEPTPVAAPGPRAASAPGSAALPTSPAAPIALPARLRAEALDRDALRDDERLLRAVFGLLVHAHHRTTPNDLVRLLDAPNLSVHVLREGARVVGVTLLAVEGGLPAADAEALRAGRRRIRGHALADILAAQCGRPEGARLRIVRSVRIATHPGLRRRGLGARLVEHVHASHAPDLFGTVFGAAPELLVFRRSLGYALVRLGVAAGAASGERAATLLRPVTPAAEALVADLRRELARNLMAWRALRDADEPWRRAPAGGPSAAFGADGALGVGEDALDAAVDEALEDVERTPLDDDALAAAARRYASGVVPFDAVAGDLAEALRRFTRLDGRPPSPGEAPGAALLRARVLERRSWADAARAAGLRDAAAAMRALRPAFAEALCDRLGPAPLDEPRRAH